MDNVSPINEIKHPDTWKFAVVAFVSLFLSAVAAGTIFGSTMDSAEEWIGMVYYVTFKSFLWGIVPALIFGALWHSFYYRTPGMPFVTYILPGPVIGILVGFFDQTLGLGLAVTGSLFLIIQHLLIRQFPGLVE